MPGTAPGGVGEAPPEGVGKGEIATPRPLSGEAAAAGLSVPLSRALLSLWGPKYVPPTPGNIWSELGVLRGLSLSGILCSIALSEGLFPLWGSPPKTQISSFLLQKHPNGSPLLVHKQGVALLQHQGLRHAQMPNLP